jgi:uncharacterized protein YciI
LVKSAVPRRPAARAQGKSHQYVGGIVHVISPSGATAPAISFEAERHVKHYLLFYSFTDGYLELRLQYRDLHLKHAWGAQRKGNLVLAGALADPVDSGVLLFQVASPDVVNEFARSDPYVVNGLVTSWRVREWVTVVGEAARTPVHPEDLPNTKGSR